MLFPNCPLKHPSKHHHFGTWIKHMISISSMLMGIPHHQHLGRSFFHVLIIFFQPSHTCWKCLRCSGWMSVPPVSTATHEGMGLREVEWSCARVLTIWVASALKILHSYAGIHNTWNIALRHLLLVAIILSAWPFCSRVLDAINSTVMPHSLHTNSSHFRCSTALSHCR